MRRTGISLKLTDEEKKKAWSWLNNLNGEAEYYKDAEGRFDNRDKTIADGLGVDVGALTSYLYMRSKKHLQKISNKK